MDKLTPAHRAGKTMELQWYGYRGRTPYIKNNNKFELMVKYDQEIRREPDVYKDYLEFKKKQEENETEVAPDGDCIIF